MAFIGGIGVEIKYVFANRNPHLITRMCNRLWYRIWISLLPFENSISQYLFCVPDPYRLALRQNHLTDIVHSFSKLFCDGQSYFITL